jgi:hypothetical protein
MNFEFGEPRVHLYILFFLFVYLTLLAIAGVDMREGVGFGQKMP